MKAEYGWRVRAVTVALCAALIMGAGGAALAQFDFEGVDCAAVFEAKSMTLLDGEAAEEKRDVAGLVKLPALLVICEAMDSGAFAPSDMLTVSERAAHATGPTAFLEAGESVSADGLMKAAVTITAADAIVTLAEHCMAESEFVSRINKRLAELDIQANAQDITGGGLTFSCRELAAVGAQLIKSPTFCAYSTMYYEELIHADGRRTELASSNKLLRSLMGCSGVATGSSQSAGYCGVFSAKRGDSEYVVAVTGAKSSSARAEIAGKALELAFTAYRTVTGVKRGDTVVTVPVKDGQAATVDLIASKDIVILLSQSENAQAHITAPELLEAPVLAGSELGRVEYVDENGKVIAASPLIPGMEVVKATIFDRIKAVFLEWLHA